MNLDFSPEDNAFRDEVRAFLTENYPQALREKQGGEEALSKDDYFSWHRILAKKGWAVPSWPVEWGGTGWTPTQKYIWSEEQARADTLPILPFGVSMLAPVIYTFGTQEQKERFLPAIRDGIEWWCQGYSEPGAGSDLASLKTKAERITADDGKEYYLVNGQKTWTTLAQHADWGFFLVRTDPNVKPQAGISFLLIDMKSPGISRCAASPPWKAATRSTTSSSTTSRCRWRTASSTRTRAGPAPRPCCCTSAPASPASPAPSAAWRSCAPSPAPNWPTTPVRCCRTPSSSARSPTWRSTSPRWSSPNCAPWPAKASGKGPGPESSILKIKGTEIQQRLTELTLEAAGHYGAPYLRDAPHNLGPVGPDFADGSAGFYFNTRKTSIYGGSNEIQRNIIAKMVLGL